MWPMVDNTYWTSTWLGFSYICVCGQRTLLLTTCKLFLAVTFLDGERVGGISSQENGNIDAAETGTEL